VRRLLGVLVVLVLLAVVADRAVAALVERALADELARPANLGTRPDVSVDGVPFLTQAVQGRYRSVDVSARDVDAGAVRLAQLDAQLTGARLPLRTVLSGGVRDVPVDLLDAAAVVSYDELGRRGADSRLSVTPEGDRLRLRGEVRVLGQDLSATALSRLSVENGEIVVTADEFDVGNRAVGDVLTPALRAVFDQRLDLALPYGLEVDGIDVQPDGLAVRASGRDAVVTAR